MDVLNVVFVVVLALTGCAFDPALDGKYSCGEMGACPSGLRCADDGICRSTSTNDAALVSRDASMEHHDLASEPDDMHGPQPHDMREPQPRDMSHTPPHDMGCVPKKCAPMDCGDELDGCGGAIACGGCMGNQTCGVPGPNHCGPGMKSCSPTSCAQLGAMCGLVSDGCAAVLSCGSCSNGATCNASNQCS
jgi:hypothetical protein